MNPYDFVPASADVRRSRAEGHHVFTGHCGVISCTLIAETPLFVPDTKKMQTKPVVVKGVGKLHKVLSFLMSGRTPVIPGSSLKGVIRTVAEAAGSGCFKLFKGSYKDKQVEFPYQIDEQLQSSGCSSRDSLCICCRIFGSISSRPALNHMGKVSIGEARAVEYKMGEKVTLAILSTPKPRHRAFYGLQGNPQRAAGRKFYYHAGEIAQANESDLNVTVTPVLSGARFNFSIRYNNLTDEELSLLLYSLELEPDLRHKIGMGKPVGLGSAKILIDSIKVIDPEVRYRNLGNGINQLTEQDLHAYINSKTQVYSNSETPTLQALRRIWRWPGEYVLRYPDRPWFNNNSNAPISETE